MGRFNQKTSPRRIATVERRRQALRLRSAGFTYEQIAQQLGYRSRSGVYRAVVEALRDTIREPAQEVRQLELRRLDEMMAAIYPRVMKGDYQAIDRLLKIMDRRAKLLGLDEPTKIDQRVEHGESYEERVRAWLSANEDIVRRIAADGQGDEDDGAGGR